MILVVAALTIGACSSSNGSSPTPSTGSGGSPWVGTFSPVALPAPVHAVRALDCPTGSRCWAVGSTTGTTDAPGGATVIATADGGASWTAQSVPPAVGFLSAVSCSDPRRCTAVGQSPQGAVAQGVIITTTDGGTAWASVPVPAATIDITAVSCLADRHCTAVATLPTGPVALSSATAGAPWVERGALPAGYSGATGLSCTSSQDCWVTAHTSLDIDHVAAAVALTTNGGATWTAVTLPTVTGTLDAISCTAGAVANGSLPYTTAPSTTASSAAPSTTTPSAAPSTSGATTPATAVPPTTTAPVVGVAGVGCTAVGSTDNTITGTRAGRGLVLTTGNGGATWTVPAVTARSAELMDVSCPSVDACVAVGSSTPSATEAGVVVLTGSGAHPWRQASAVLSPEPLAAVSCTSDAQCLVAGEALSEHLVGG